jgi:threonine aldolase
LFKGDTITIPTDNMLQAGIGATRGDDVYRDDQATIDLEERIARLTGKEAGLFVPSGTMSNRKLDFPPWNARCSHNITKAL